MIKFEIDEETGIADAKISNDIFTMVTATTYFISLTYNEFRKREKRHADAAFTARAFKEIVQSIIANDNSPTWEFDEEEQNK